MDAFRLLLLTLASLIDRRNEQITAYLRAENEILREHLGLERGTQPAQPCVFAVQTRNQC